MESSFDIFDSAIKQALKNYYTNQDYDDMYQECYMKILEVLKNNTYDPVYNLYGYAYTIARNTISSFRYHSDKLTTLVEGDLPEILQVNSGVDLSEDYNIKDSAEQACIKYKNVLPDGFTVEDALNLLYNEDPTKLVLIVLKGEILWMLESYHN